MNDSNSNVSNNAKRYDLEDEPKCQNPNAKVDAAFILNFGFRI